MTARATVVVVAYRTAALDLGWLPADVSALVVHNDAALDEQNVRHPMVRHLHPPANVGFGAAVNLAAAEVRTERLVLVNPDVRLLPEHWPPLVAAGRDDVATVPLDDAAGAPTAVVAEYPGPLRFLLGAWRAGRLAPRGSRRRERLLPSGRPPGSWSLDRCWVSGAVCSVDRDRFLSVGGFDPGYFLYYEDVDLCRRLARAFPGMRAVLADTAPGVHAVGGSAPRDEAAAVAKLRRAGARRYAAGNEGPAWRAVAALVGWGRG